MRDIFLTDLPVHERLGFGAMKIGEVIQIDLLRHGMTSMQARGHIGSHGAYYGKKFKTKTKGDILHVKRIS